MLHVTFNALKKANPYFQKKYKKLNFTMCNTMLKPLNQQFFEPFLRLLIMLVAIEGDLFGK